MTSRPVTLILLAAFNAAVALAMPIQIMILYGHPLSEWVDIGNKLTPFNWLVILAATINASMIFKVSRLTLYLTPAVFAIVALNNFFVSLYAMDYSPLVAGLGVAVFAFMHWPLVTQTNLGLLNDRKLHWWRTAPRRQVSLPVSLGDARHWAYHANTYDVSESGVFVALDDKALELPSELSHQKDFRVRLSLGNQSYLTCDAKIVRQAHSHGRHPAGVGIQFGNMPYSDRRALRRALSHLN